jgi:hypothetical protein
MSTTTYRPTRQAHGTRVAHGTTARLVGAVLAGCLLAATAGGAAADEADDAASARLSAQAEAHWIATHQGARPMQSK